MPEFSSCRQSPGGTVPNGEWALSDPGPGFEAWLSDATTPSGDLVLTQWGMSIPGDTVISGVEVKITRRCADIGTEPGGRIKDFTVELVGTPSSTNKADAVSEWPQTSATKVYGADNDLWGNGSLDLSTVNSTDFGFKLNVQYSGPEGGESIAFFEEGEICVWYDATGSPPTVDVNLTVQESYFFLFDHDFEIGQIYHLPLTELAVETLPPLSVTWGMTVTPVVTFIELEQLAANLDYGTDLAPPLIDIELELLGSSVALEIYVSLELGQLVLDPGNYETLIIVGRTLDSPDLVLELSQPTVAVGTELPLTLTELRLDELAHATTIGQSLTLQLTELCLDQLTWQAGTFQISDTKYIHAEPQIIYGSAENPFKLNKTARAIRHRGKNHVLHLTVVKPILCTVEANFTLETFFANLEINDFNYETFDQYLRITNLDAMGTAITADGMEPPAGIPVTPASIQENIVVTFFQPPEEI